MNKHLRRIGIVLLYILAAFSILLAFSLKWALDTWPDLRMEEIIYELQAPLEGTGNGMIGQYMLHAALPACVIFLLIVAVTVFLVKKKRRYVYRILAAVSVLVLVISLAKAWGSLHLGEWLHDELHPSTFIEDHYADPAKTAITFPEKKRNLIFIYLESMENTFADRESGGAFEKNCIPELTELSLENENFSGNSGILNGGIPMSGTTWTMGAMFGTTSGLPLKTSIGSNAMSTQAHFFPGIRTLGDILEDEGYSQTLLIGSEAKFGGRELYFREHGNYKMEDYHYALENGLIPAGYEVWWGYEDEKLFAFAKDTATKLAGGDEPFNLTILTADTHFENGYLCRLCGDTFGDNKYANVMACSSRQVSDFVKWIQQQDFYANTTVIVVVDHLTMDKDFCASVPKDYRRTVFTSYINADARPEDPSRVRTYTTYDTFPTTLAAIGAEIEGNRLGLGSNLYSSVDTLAEEFGVDGFREQVKQKSVFLEKLEEVDENVYAKTPGATVICTGYDEDAGDLTIHVQDIRGLTEPLASVRVYLTDGNGKVAAEASADAISAENACDLRIHADPQSVVSCRLSAELKDAAGKTETVLREEANPLLLTGNDLTSFMNGLDFMKRYGKYTLAVSVKGDGSANFTDETRAAFKKFGLMEDLSSKPQRSYLAVSTSEGSYEECSEERLEHKEQLPDETWIKVVSKGGEGSKSSIIFGGTDYSTNKKGFNLVVYDESLGTVIAKKYIDNALGDAPEGSCTFETAGRFQNLGRIHVRVSDINLTEKQHRHVLIAYWYEDKPEDIKTMELTKGGTDDYIGLIKGRVFNKSPLHVQVYFVSTYQIWRTAGIMQ